jgi:hypothetical protein
VPEVPEIVARWNLLDQIRRRPTSLCVTILIESLPITQQIEAIPVFIEFGEPTGRKRFARNGAFTVGRVSPAPIQQREQKPEHRYAIHRIARSDLTYAARLQQGGPDANAAKGPIGPEHRDPLLFEQVVLFRFVRHCYLVRKNRHSLLFAPSTA